MGSYKEAEATYSYKVGSIEDTITVGAKSDTPRTRDDWVINLVIDAGIALSEKHDTDLQSIQFKLIQARLR